MTPRAARTIVEQLADFAYDTEFDALPADVIVECKRLVLDSLGCALAGVDSPKGRIGAEYGRMLGGSGGRATIVGGGQGFSVFGAAFANGELINAIDFDPILPPGHVTPYVLPGALAIAEEQALSGTRLICAVAIAHEMSYRFGKAMDVLRDVKGDKVGMPEVLGYSSTIFGATAAIGKLKGTPRNALADGLGIAGCIAPVNSFRAWCMHTPVTTLKYQMAGSLIQAALTAAHMAQFGHTGVPQILDDREFGYPKFIGTSRWEPERLTHGLGDDWSFLGEQSYKPYPHARSSHGSLDALTSIIEDNELSPDEIEHIHAWGESFAAEYPVWRNRTIQHVQDAQYSVPHVLSVAAHRISPRKAWQDPDTVFSPSVLALTDRITYEPHPEYDDWIANDSGSRPTRVEVRARGEIFVAECSYPKGSPSSDPRTVMTTAELADKFRENAAGVLHESVTESVIDDVLRLESADDFGQIMQKLSKRMEY